MERHPKEPAASPAAQAGILFALLTGSSIGMKLGHKGWRIETPRLRIARDRKSKHPQRTRRNRRPSRKKNTDRLASGAFDLIGPFSSLS
jgi:hypothetical protein